MVSFFTIPASFTLDLESLGEHKIRELNDGINKLLLEKFNWEKRILDLGGPNLLSSPNPPEYKFVPLNCYDFFYGSPYQLDFLEQL